MNNFYASVECMLDPALKKYPVAVCGSVEERHGIVLAKNYAAKAFNVKTGDAVWQAKQKCRKLVVVPPHFEEYIKYSKLARSVYSRYTDQVEPYGMDECWLDISGTDRIFGSAETVANEIRETIKFELGLTISVGVSFNKIFAKLGSDMKKPDAVTVIPKDTFREKIWGLPAADLLGVGRATQRVLDKWVNRSISCPEYVQSIYKMMNWNKDCRYKVYGRLANSERGLVLVFDLASAVMFDPLPEEYFDKHTGKMKKRIVKYYPDEIRMKLGRSYSDYEALQQRSSFESLSGYMDTSGGAVPATVSEELAASISMQEQEKKRETLFGTIIGNGGDDDVRNNE